jgi:hypothetical protein
MLFMENFGFTHETAALLVGIIGFSVAGFAIAAAKAVDDLATLKLPLIASALASVARLGIALIVSFGKPLPLLTILLLVLAVAFDGVLISQALLLALNRHIDQSGGGAAGIFGVRYSLGNSAVLLVSLSYDALRTFGTSLKEANAVAQWLGFLMSIATLAVIVLAFYADADAETTTGAAPSRPPPPPSLPLLAEVKALVRDPNLWRFSIFCLLLLSTSSIFRHIEQTLPPVMQRLFTDRVHFALVQAINPLAVIILTPVLQWLTAQRRAYWVITAGTVVSSLSLLPLVIAGGKATYHAAALTDYLPYVVFMLFFSVGEALWSARFTVYALDAAPEHGKALYLAVASIPRQIASLVAAWHSAYLVRTFCNTPATCAPRGLWLTVWALSLIAPIFLTITSRWLEQQQRKSAIYEMD